MEIEDIGEKCNDAMIEVTAHMLRRLQKRKLTYAEIKQALMSGEIIEDYPSDYPYPSCLVAGNTLDDRMIHIVAGIGAGKLWLITAYEPNPDEWDKSFKVRKEQS